MADNKTRVTELAELMQEFRLNEAHLTADGLSVGFRRKSTVVTKAADSVVEVHESEEVFADHAPAAAQPEAPKGMPISSPMTGIFYNSPSPSSPPFVREGDVVAAGQIIGLIEAMKVFNEIPSPLSGTVVKVAAQSGQLVQPGEPILFIG